MKKILSRGNALFLSCLAAAFFCQTVCAQNWVTNYVTGADPTNLQAAITTAQTNGGYIYFTTNATFTLLQPISISTNFYFDAGTNTVVLSGGGKVRVFSVSSGGNLNLFNISVINGAALQGGGIFNDGGEVSIEACTFQGNSIAGKSGVDGADGTQDHFSAGNGTDGRVAQGGAIYSRGNLYVYDSVFLTNTVTGGDGGNGGVGAPDVTLGGKGGNGGNGGSACGGAIYCLGGTGTNRIENTIFMGNGAGGGNGGTPGAAGSGAFAPDGAKGGAGGTSLGAAICSQSPLQIIDCLFAGNNVYAGSSAGVFPNGNGSSAAANSGASAFGGAVYNNSFVHAENCTFYQNYCEGGVGGNVPSYHAKAGNGGDAGGGALASVGSASVAQLVNCTLATNSVMGGTNGVASNTDNDGVKGRSIGGALYHSGGVLKLSNSILARGTNGANCYGGVTDGGYNISSDTSCGFTATGSRNNVNPMLDTLKDRGGGTLTLALLPGSPAIGALGTNVYYPPVDQRGTPRPQGLKADIGAFENDASTMLPVITNQPSSLTAGQGTDVSFSTVFGGQGPFTFQWNWNGNPIWGATNSTLVIAFVQKADAGNYSVVISNEYGSVTSSSAALSIVTPVTISAQPQSMNVLLGDDAAFSVSASGEGYLAYQWYLSGSPLASQTNSTLQITNAQPQNAGVYTVTISNAVGKVTSSNATLSVNVPAKIIVPPQNRKVLAFTTVTLSVQAQGDQPLFYQWERDGQPIAGATSANYIVTVGSTNLSGLTVAVTNLYGMAVSDPVSITVCSPPAIVLQPVSTNIITGPGHSAMFSVGVKGNDPITYQWFCDGAAIGGATNFNLLLTNIQAGVKSTYTYSVTAIDAIASVTSSNVTLTVNASPSIATQPRAQTVMVGSNLTLNVVAIGDKPLACQWTWNGTPLPGATNFNFTLSGVQLTNSGSYAVIVTNTFGSATSSNAVVTVSERVSIANCPKNQTVSTGATVVFDASAVGKPGPFHFQWYFNNRALVGATNTSLVLSNVKAGNAGLYKVVVSNAVSSAVSTNATLKVLNPPNIVSVSKPQSVLWGAKVTLSASATGTAPLYYQWQCQGTNIPGANRPTLVLAKAAPQNAGLYTVMVSNLVGQVTNTTALSLIAPAPAIKSPVASQFTNANIRLTGTVPAGSQITNIAITLNGSALPAVAVAGDNTWSVDLVLTPGTNKLSAISEAAYGISTATLRNYLLIANDRLTLTFSNGSVSPNLNGQFLQLGRQYTIKATPASGMIFSNWTVGATSISPALTFTMRSNLVLQANFTPDPFAPRKGTYLGLFGTTNAPQNNSLGFVSLSLRELGAFSGKILQGTNAYNLSGQFDSSGAALIRTAGTTIGLVLDATGGSALDPLQGRIIGPGWTAPFQANRLVFNASTNRAPAQGKYTVVIPAGGDSQTPGGSGAMAVSVDAGGTVTFTGALADGTAVAGSGTMCAGDQWPFYLSFYSGRGGIWGWIGFTNDPAGLYGDLNWICPSGTKICPSGFRITLPIESSPYQAPLNSVPALSMTNASATLTGGNLDMSLTNAITLGSDNVFVNGSTNLFVLKIDPSNGLVSGRFFHPATKAITPIQGAVLQDQNTIAGFFLGTNQSGSLLVSP